MRRVILFLLFFFLLWPGGLWAAKVDELIFLPKGDYFQATHQALQKAKDSIHLVMYVVKKGPGKGHPVNLLLQDLIKARKRGVRVRVILDESAKGFADSSLNTNAYNTLLKNGVNVSYDSPKKVTHVKLLIVDDYITILGSHNWSLLAFQSNNESSVLIKSHKVARDFLRFFWSDYTPKLRLEDASSIKMTHPQGYLQMAENYYLNRMYEEALGEYQNLIREFPESKEALIAQKRIKEIKASK